MSDMWNIVQTQQGSSKITTTTSSYSGYDYSLVQNPENVNLITNDLPWETLLPFPNMNAPLLANLDWSAPIHANGPIMFACNTTLWNAPNFLDISDGVQPTPFPPQTSVPTPKFPLFQQGRSQTATTGAPSSWTPIHNHMVSGRHFDLVCDSRHQVSQTRQSRGLHVPNDERIETSKKIVEIMTSFKVMLNQDAATLDAEIARARETLTDYISSLSQDAYRWIENQRRNSIGAPSARNHSATRRRNVDERGLYLCLWCNETLTTKINFSTETLNLADHIRAHLKLHLSFCEYCNFSSVTPKLPMRHKCRKSNRNN